MNRARILTAAFSFAAIALAACSDPRIGNKECARWEPHTNEIVNLTRKVALDRCTERYKGNSKVEPALFDVSQQWIGDANRVQKDFPADCNARSTQTYSEAEEKCFQGAKVAADLSKCTFPSRFFSDLTVRLTKLDQKMQSDCDGLGKLATLSTH